MNEVRNINLKSGAAVTLRPARGDDAKGIVETIRSSAEERSSLIMEMHGKNIGSERTFIEKLDLDNNLLLVAVSGDKVVGCLAALNTPDWEDHSSRLIEVGLHIRDSFRGGGLGSAMLAYSMEWARSNGFRKMITNIFSSSRRSIGLFTKQGFREVAAKNIQTTSSSLNKVVLLKLL